MADTTHPARASRLGEAEIRALTIEDVVARLEVVRARYFMPDTSAWVRYLPAFDPDPEDLSVKIDPNTERHVSAEETGRFTLPRLVTELELAYMTVHLFPTRQARDFFVAGFDGALRQVEFIGGQFDWNRLWMTAGTANIGVPIVVFLGQRAAVNNRPSVSLIDHRQVVRGRMAYRAVGGSGAHVGEEYYPVVGPEHDVMNLGREER
ncbi:hypothetical protein [Salinarimonas ramus]|uniref:Uncharacterized protein n=1 Tax=Salinarimonas ramus TaxID=690164 RepID=A0A917V7T2_9HYPH|nr:hypothetical protein [Salinarimonas ramus]GGK49656.1 hypothetical protein GCM10011322_40840 [Salinarimonas ramus]